MNVEAFFDHETFTLSYIVYDPQTKDAIIIDPVLDLNTRTWRFSTTSIDQLEHFIRTHDLIVHWALDTHAHADHVSGMQEVKARFGAKLGIGANITIVQETFNAIFNSSDTVPTDGSQFDRLFADGDTIQAGSLSFKVLHTPGHTPACVVYKIGTGIFVGDVLFMPDVGVARCDFPKASAQDLYRSITQKLYTLPGDTRVFVGHDYQPYGRELCYQTSIAASKKQNIDLGEGMSEEEFVHYIQRRDSSLPVPRLLFESVQLNINAGQMPSAEANGQRYLKMALNVL